MLPLLIISTAIFTLVNAHPQGGSQNVLGWCATEVPRCNFSSLYDCMNRGGFQMCYCINHCRCENKNEPPGTAEACAGQTNPDPVPAPTPISDGEPLSEDTSAMASLDDTTSSESTPDEGDVAFAPEDADQDFDLESGDTADAVR